MQAEIPLLIGVQHMNTMYNTVTLSFSRKLHMIAVAKYFRTTPAETRLLSEALD